MLVAGAYVINTTYFIAFAHTYILFATGTKDAKRMSLLSLLSSDSPDFNDHLGVSPAIASEATGTDNLSCSASALLWSWITVAVNV